MCFIQDYAVALAVPEGGVASPSIHTICGVARISLFGSKGSSLRAEILLHPPSRSPWHRLLISVQQPQYELGGDGRCDLYSVP